MSAAKLSREERLQLTYKLYCARVEELGGTPFSYKEWCGK
jgi:hypothetical protein